MRAWSTSASKAPCGVATSPPAQHEERHRECARRHHRRQQVGPALCRGSHRGPAAAGHRARAAHPLGASHARPAGGLRREADDGRQRLHHHGRAWPRRCRAWSRPGRRCRSSACRCPTSDLQGQDALLAIVQMPPGIPVATMAIGTPGARNAAWFAAAILGARRPGGGPGHQTTAEHAWPRACSRTTRKRRPGHDRIPARHPDRPAPA